MVVDILPEWVMQGIISVEGLRTVVSSHIDTVGKTVYFKITSSGWLTKANSNGAKAICSTIAAKADCIKKRKEDQARASGWRVIDGPLATTNASDKLATEINSFSLAS